MRWRNAFGDLIGGMPARHDLLVQLEIPARHENAVRVNSGVCLLVGINH